jgi:dihydrofolate synthase / folylpolyglutamate synthase
MIPLLDTYKQRWGVHSEQVIKPGLAAIVEALEMLNNPHKVLQVAHFAGTNGKGSTLTFVEFIARAHGLSVGKFMSPCIVDVHDQIQINGVSITEQQMDQVFERLAKAGLSGKLTDFELLTTAAFLFFQQQQVDVVLVETGMGGREDSTNVVDPIVSVIPSIALEHTNFLGKTLTSIAGHKAGIIKHKKPVVIGRLPDEAYKVIHVEAEKNNAPLWELGQQFHVEKVGTSETYKNTILPFNVGNLHRSLLGTHQGDNMALAITAFLEIARKFSITPSIEQIQQGVSNAQLAGRFEQVMPNIYFDGAHNPASIRTLVDTVKQHFGTKRIEFVVGILADKDVSSVLTILEEVGDAFYFVDIKNNRAMPAAIIYELSKAKEKAIIQDVVPLLQQPIAENTIRIVTGSLYLLSEIRQKIQKNSSF